MAFFKIMFISMTIRYTKALWNSETRLWYGIPGPFLVAASIAIVLTGGPPVLAVALFPTGSALMRIQASMIESHQMKSLRNGGVLVLAFMLLFAFLGDYLWSAVGSLLGIGLLALHRHHESMLKKRNYRSSIARVADAQRRMGLGPNS